MFKARFALTVVGLPLIHVAILRNAYDVAVGLGLAYACINLVVAFSVGRGGQTWKPWLAPVCLMLAAQIAISMGYEAAIGLVLAPSIVVNVFLLVVFGHTLLPRREPLITRFRRFHVGHVTPAFASYTRLLTVLWTVLFAMAAALSIAAAISGDVGLWSWISIIAMPLASLLLFVGEHVYRAIRYGTEEQSSPLKTVQIMLHPGAWRDTSDTRTRLAADEHE